MSVAGAYYRRPLFLGTGHSNGGQVLIPQRTLTGPWARLTVWIRLSRDGIPPSGMDILIGAGGALRHELPQDEETAIS
jgi:hypothetical protein